MLPYRDSRLTKIVLAIFFLIVIAYAYYEAHGIIFGPTIDIASQAMTVADNPYVLIEGQADRIASLSVDGQPIQVTETGAFKEPYVLAPGVNRIVFDAKDKYGNAAQKVIEIVYTPAATPIQAVPAATSTPATDSTTSTSSRQAGSTTLTASSSPDSVESPTGSVTAPIAPGQ